MGEKNNKIILAALIIILVIIAVVLVAILMTKDTKQVTQTPQVQEQTELKKEITPLTEEKKEELAAIKVTTGTLTSIDIARINVLTPEGDLELMVPQQGASFVNQTIQEDGSFLIEDVGLFDLPTDKEVEIQYNSASNTVMLVTVQ